LSARADSTPVSVPNGQWIYRPWLDFLVGCGAWSAPLLAIAAWMTPSHTHAWGVAFYLLAIVFNYPHFMATIYRAYHTRAEFEKYKIVTLHVTLLMVFTGVLLHAFYWLLPWVFTLYICWSPWHYTGQNYGLLMMFVRRGGATMTLHERRWIRTAFIAAYLMLLASFETGGSSDPLIVSLGIPAKFTLPARLILGTVFVISVLIGFRRLISRSSWRTVAAPLTLALTQFLWFVLPTFLELHAAYQIPQTRYSSGILAVLHSAQYLWITSYYQQREARAAGKLGWRMATYFLTLISGGIALFIPGPWLVSRIFHFDFTTSVLIFTAIVNIHHFILDGALWKLRDSRVASVLVGGTSGGKARPSDQAGTLSPPSVNARTTPSTGRRILSPVALRVSLVALLFLWGGMDQVHFALGTDEGNLPALRQAARLNPYDSMLQARIALAEAKEGRRPEELAAFTRAVAINPYNAALQHACARALIQNGLYAEAYDHYAKMIVIFPRDFDALVNYGLLAARLGHPEVAMASWEKAEQADPNQPNPHLYLAEALDQKGDFAPGARHWKAFLRFASEHPDDPAAGAAQQTSATIQLADDESRLGNAAAASHTYSTAIALAQHTGDAKLESLALAHLADLQEKGGDVKSAASSYQRGLVLDEQAADPRSSSFDLFNYGQFLRRHGLPDELAYACFLRAERLMAGNGGNDLETVKSIRQQVESHLGQKAVAVQGNLPVMLARATELPTDSF
jgi:tetratricopeptide (TPR) repeat protein